jgi:hypothetical protein
MNRLKSLALVIILATKALSRA